jgi:eukaryotic-like serine/threonine-protein kinase
VITVFDVSEHHGAMFMVMELLEGESFEQLARRGDVSIGTALSLLTGAMRGVAAAHRHGIVHRDIKSENLLVVDGAPGLPARIKVLDFGISKLTDEPSRDLSVTEDDTAIGTPLFMSFEQLCLAREVDARTDVYSFGVLLYRTLTGIIPFDAESIAAVAVLIATYRPPPPRVVRPELPESLSALVMKAMAFDRAERYPTMDALIDELESMTLSYHVLHAPIGQDRSPRMPPAANLGLSSIDGPPVEPVGTVPPFSRVPAWLPIGGAAVLVTLMVTASFWLFPSAPARPLLVPPPRLEPGPIVPVHPSDLAQRPAAVAPPPPIETLPVDIPAAPPPKTPKAPPRRQVITEQVVAEGARQLVRKPDF